MKVGALAGALGATLALAAQAHGDDTYPRIGGDPISSPHDYKRPEYVRDLAKLDVSVLAVYPGWKTMDDVARRIHEINPHSRVTVYVLAESFRLPAPAVWKPMQAKIDAEQWWLTTSDGNKVLSDYGHGTYILNITPFARKDEDGHTFGQWFAGFVNDTYVEAMPHIDGIYTDNVFWKPRRDGDWNRDGKDDSNKDPTVQRWFRTGYRQYADRLRDLIPPGKIMLANVADWVRPNAVITEYEGVFDGGVLEGMIGKSYSIEDRQGWAAMMAGYRKVMAAFRGPKLGIFEQHGDKHDYQSMRYGLTSCLMDDGYYTFNDIATKNYGVNWFDEYDAKLGMPRNKPTSAWQKGVWRRDFDGGIALVNPKGNGMQEVTLEEDFVKLKGEQAPSVNNGQTVRKVVLQDRDGIILMRKKHSRHEEEH
jgi:hypothetical protein